MLAHQRAHGEDAGTAVPTGAGGLASRGDRPGTVGDGGMDRTVTDDTAVAHDHALLLDASVRLP
jgi:hypothetical protein